MGARVVVCARKPREHARRHSTAMPVTRADVVVGDVHHAAGAWAGAWAGALAAIVVLAVALIMCTCSKKKRKLPNPEFFSELELLLYLRDISGKGHSSLKERKNLIWTQDWSCHH